MQHDGHEPQKIANRELRQFAAANTAEPVSVLIEIDLPSPVVSVARTENGELSLRGARIRSDVSAADLQVAEGRIRQATEFLEKLLGKSPRWLPGAHSFAARVTPQQLRAIASSPTVKAIWPNRELRAHAGGVRGLP